MACLWWAQEIRSRSRRNVYIIAHRTSPRRVTSQSSPSNIASRRPPGYDYRAAISFLGSVRRIFPENLVVYNAFLHVLRLHQVGMMNTRDVLHIVSVLFGDHPALMDGFRDFMPEGYIPTAEPVDLLSSAAMNLSTGIPVMKSSSGNIVPLLEWIGSNYEYVYSLLGRH
ncbi:hypothetical protein C8Q74DRAFT_1037118 [Fomes fomentarius]|nr:hypothetical protein C8Q74DRAFT_1037118 [Fomes fomentarius]